MSSTSQRNLAIDCLRGFSVIAVLFCHEMIPLSVFGFSLDSALATKLFPNGFFGVSIFFVISGFLISRNCLLRYGSLDQIDFRQFYPMRLARIGPCLVLFLSMASIFFLFDLPEFGGQMENGGFYFANSVYHALTFQYHTYFLSVGSMALKPFSVLWSLSIEEIFYLIFPIVCLLLARTWAIVGVLLICIVVATLSRNRIDDIYSWWGNVDLLAMGCLTAILSSFKEDFKVPRFFSVLLRLLGLFLIGIFLLNLELHQDFKFGISLVGFSASLFLVGNSFLENSTSTPRWLSFSFPAMALGFIGTLSYEIYVFHLTFRRLAVHYLPGWEQSFTMLTVLVIVCALISKNFSEPLNRKIRQFYRFESPLKTDRKRI